MIDLVILGWPIIEFVVVYFEESFAIVECRYRGALSKMLDHHIKLVVIVAAFPKGSV